MEQILRDLIAGATPDPNNPGNSINEDQLLGITFTNFWSWAVRTHATISTNQVNPFTTLGFFFETTQVTINFSEGNQTVSITIPTPTP